jgi:hypothetical protein
MDVYARFNTGEIAELMRKISLNTDIFFIIIE